MSERRTIAERLRAAGLSTERFIQCLEGQKGSHDHTMVGPDDVEGNYGIYATARDALCILDVDDYDEVDDSGLDALAELDDTLEQSSPHDGVHKLYRVEMTADGRMVSAVLADEFGAKNPKPSWGEIRTSNQYVVGAGSELDGCGKDWHDCSEPGEGRYEIKADREIATISAEELVETLRVDHALQDDEPEPAPTTEGESEAEPPSREDSEFTTDDILSFARDRDDKLANLLDGNYRAAGYTEGGDVDRSTAECALAFKLAFWLGGDKPEVESVIDHRARTMKWDQRGQEYRQSVLEAVDEQSEYFDPDSVLGADSGDTPAQKPAPDLDDDEVERAMAIEAERTGPESPPGGLMHRDGGYGYLAETKDENGNQTTVFQQVTNFTLETLSYIDTYEGELINVRVQPSHPMEDPYEVQVHPTVFNEPRTFREEIVRGRTTRFQPQRDIREVLNDLRQLVGSQFAPHHDGTEYIGLHGADYDEWVSPAGTLTGDGWADRPEYTYYEKGGDQERQTSLEQKWQLDPEEIDDYDGGEVSDILEKLGWIRRPERGLSVLAWFYAAPLKPLIHDIEGQFNLLQVTGGTGTGKTSTLEIYQELFGGDPDPFGCDSTGFSIEKKFASSCGLPIWLDEYKPSDMAAGKLKWLHRRLREVFREMSVSKGRQDLGEITFRMRAPVVFSGEQTVQEPAVRRRSIITNFSTEGTTGRYEEAYCKLKGAGYTKDGGKRYPEGKNLQQHAYAYYTWMLEQDRDRLSELWKAAREEAAGHLSDLQIGDLDESEFQGMQTIVFGFRLFRAFADSVGATAEKLPDETELQRALRHFAQNIGPDGQRREHIDEFTELLSQAANAGYLEEGVTHRLIDSQKWERDVLAFHMPTAFSNVKRYVREYNLEDDYVILGKDDYVGSFADKADDEKTYPLATNQRVRGLETGSKAVYIDPQKASDLLGDGFTTAAFVEDPDGDDDSAAGGDDDDDGADPISALAEGDRGVTVEARVTDIDADQPDAIAQKAEVQDTTGTTRATVWADAEQPALEEGEAYRFKDVSVQSYQGDLELHVNEYSGVESVAAGVGNVPTADPGANDQLGTAATDGGAKTNGTEGSLEIAQAIVSHLQEKAPKPKTEIVTAMKMDSSHDYDGDELKRGFEKAKQKGMISESPEGGWQV